MGGYDRNGCHHLLESVLVALRATQYLPTELG